MGGSAAEDLQFPSLTSMDSKSGETMEALSGTGSDNAGTVAAEMVDFINAAWTPFHAVRKCYGCKIPVLFYFYFFALFLMSRHMFIRRTLRVLQAPTGELLEYPILALLNVQMRQSRDF